MVAPVQSSTQSKIYYPEDDGLPMSDNTLQFRWITVIQYNLDWLFADNPQVFVAGNLLWYPVEGYPKICQAPDIMVAFGVEKGERGSYKQWEEHNTAPQVAFEILSPSNTLKEMNKKLLFYARYGVEEYYIYDPQKNDLSGWIRSDNDNENFSLSVIEEMENWVSPRLQIRFVPAEEELQIYLPNGEAFATYSEVRNQLEQAQVRAEQAQIRAEQAEQRLKEMEELLNRYRNEFGDLSE
ncbi:Uma2 family endonuclease [Limnoraphis robusta Tam1]|uniref:Uma2 family endonuclease n=2 Tax=Limnoraphis robusta TaxID=1118279 RepID=A0ABU5U7F1_9CYAN|nr:Uma2 family endonuclease [Limnoraphis robusta]KKD38332.1 hypothetical protein WN50_09440 [Limnoraphis robusta CS-951]MEA5523104.1 Uma2 family endonuclease [Limnoraphis robusta CCNP1315]MEA5537885.1 Uma2 family endonuclease [Limnoraphis robusta Tam1]MEA5548092.1 Uma2 family endonuclease [Limnoraphis robusta CCNP1324]